MCQVEDFDSKSQGLDRWRLEPDFDQHRRIGIDGQLYWPALVLFGRGKWTVHGRHGGALDGANTVRFMKKIEAMRRVVPVQALPILDTLELFREIQHGCFGWELSKDYKEKIHKFTESVASL